MKSMQMANPSDDMGTFPPNEKAFRGLPRQFAIPAAAVPGDSLVIAVRFWLLPLLSTVKGGVRSPFARERGIGAWNEAVDRAMSTACGRATFFTDGCPTSV